MSSSLVDLAVILSSLSLIAFGGGNVILSELQQQIVVVHGWMTSREFLDIFSISRSIPGPSMIMVLPVGYQVAGVSGAAVAVLCMFVPVCLIMYGCSSLVDRLHENPWMQTTLRAACPGYDGTDPRECFYPWTDRGNRLADNPDSHRKSGSARIHQGQYPGPDLRIGITRVPFLPGPVKSGTILPARG